MIDLISVLGQVVSTRLYRRHFFGEGTFRQLDVSAPDGYLDSLNFGEMLLLV